MPTSALLLAALADAAVPGLLPTGVRMLPGAPCASFERALVTGLDGRRWLVRCALTPSAGSGLDQSTELLPLLRGRLPVRVPEIAGLARTPEHGVVAVYPELPGRILPAEELTAGGGAARAVGETLAAVHDLDPRLYDEAGLPSYSADEYRTRRLVDLDRAATTGVVPPVLLGRWEQALEARQLWDFETTPTHGPVDGTDLWASVGDDLGADGGALAALDGWHEACVADPAADLSLLMLGAPQDALDTVIEAYARARRERPDPYLERRIRLAAELRLVADLMRAVECEDDGAVERAAQVLHGLAARTVGDDSLLPPPSAHPPAPSAPVVDPDDIEALDAGDDAEDDETLELPLGSRVDRSAPPEHAEPVGDEPPLDEAAGPAGATPLSRLDDEHQDDEHEADGHEDRHDDGHADPDERRDRRRRSEG